MAESGFDPAQVHCDHLGLFGIRERAGYLDGVVEIRSAAGRGTAITLTLPV